MQYIFLEEVSYTGWSGQTLRSDSFAPEARAEGTSIAKPSQFFEEERLVITRRRDVSTIITLSSEQAPVGSRRQFCTHACQAASLVAVSAFLPACGGGDDGGSPTAPTDPSSQALTVINGSTAGRTVSVPVSTGPLAAANGAALVQSPVGSFLVYRSSQTSFNVLTAVCTHEGCTVDGFNGQQFVCPCHGSRYTTGGAVANGPANRALTSYPSTLTGDTLTFTA
jgi:Rieske Fe-S protein